MANLIEAMKQISEQLRQVHNSRNKEIEALNLKYAKQISELKIAYRELDKLNTACLKCEGKGKYKTYTNVYDDHGVNIRCDKCGGSGLKKNE